MTNTERHLPSPFESREVWFLTGSQDLYGEDTLAEVASQSRDIVAALNAAGLPVRVVWKDTSKDRDAIRRIILDANRDDACVGVIAWMHTFSPAKMWINGIGALNKPLLHFHTQASQTLPWSTIDMDYMNLNQSAHGDREFGYLLTRMGIRRKTVVGHASDTVVHDAIGRWMRAAVGWAELHDMRVCRFGDNMRNVAVTEGDKTEAEVRFGCSVNTWPVNDLVDEVARVSEEAIDTLVAEYERDYDVEEVLARGGERHESLRYAAAQEIALRTILERVGATAFTDTFEDLGGLRQLPGLAVQRLMEQGYGFGAEGDWKTAVLVRLAKVMGYGLAGGASLMEDYCYEMTPGKEKILGAHMLEICPTLTTTRPRIEIHPLGIGDREDPVRMVFTADAGQAIVVAMSDMRSRFRLTANIVDCVEPDAPLEKLPVAHAVWQPRPDFHTSTRCWLASGGAHHTVMTSAVDRETWEDFARIAEVEFAVIDRETTVDGFHAALTLGATRY